VKLSRRTTSASLLLLWLGACASGSAARPAPVAVPSAARVEPNVAAAPSPPPATGACRLLDSTAARAQGLADTRIARARAPADREAAFALARCTHRHADVEKDDARVIALSEEGMAALAHLPADDAEAAYLYAVNLGLFLRARGMMAVGRLSELVARLKVATAMPALDDGGPLRVLGLLYVKAPGWPIGPGDLEAALEILNRAVRDYPDHPLNHLYLAYALVDAGERGRARDELARARALCLADRFGDFAARWREEADQLAARAR
jgi:tetratricopeptide (TPR) repeat protein